MTVGPMDVVTIQVRDWSAAVAWIAPGFRVDDLDGFVTSLRGAGVTVDERIDGEGEGYRLARFWDPEGKPAARLHLRLIGRWT